MKPIFGSTREDAWLKAVKHLLHVGGHIEYNLIMEIENPLESDARATNIPRASITF